MFSQVLGSWWDYALSFFWEVMVTFSIDSGSNYLKKHVYVELPRNILVVSSGMLFCITHPERTQRIFREHHEICWELLGATGRCLELLGGCWEVAGSCWEFAGSLLGVAWSC